MNFRNFAAPELRPARAYSPVGNVFITFRKRQTHSIRPITLGGKMKKLSLIIVLLSLLASSFAQTSFTATYTFGAKGNVSSFSYNGTIYPEVKMGNMVKTGVTTSSSKNNFRATAWPDSSDANGGTLDLDKYIGFTVTADPGYKFSINSINFGIGKSSTGTRCTQWRGSYDSFGTPFTSYTLGSDRLSNNAGVIENPVGIDGAWTNNVLTPGTNYHDITSSCEFRMYMYHAQRSVGTAGLQGSITISGTYQLNTNDPVFSVSPASLGGFSYDVGSGPSAAQIFAVSGANLTSNLSLTTSSNFELSLDNNSYSTSLNLAPVNGAVQTTTIYTRLVAGLNENLYSSEQVTIAYTGLADKTVALSGKVTQPRYFVDFEGPGETKGSYASGTITLSGIQWNMTDVMTGSDANDYKEGLRSARFSGRGTSVMTMLENKPHGAGQISFKHRRYASDSQVSWVVEYSTDDGVSWSLLDPVKTDNSKFTPGTEVQTFSHVLNSEANIRLRIRHESGSGTSFRRMNVDNISISHYPHYDFYDNVPKQVGNDNITIVGGNANYNDQGTLSPIPNAENFTASFHRCLTLIGTGPWTINIDNPDADYAAYKQGGTWNSVLLDEGVGSLQVTAAKNSDIELLTGSGNDPTLPVTLSHFSAILNAQNQVQLTWVSQSESNLLGYQVYRNSAEELSSALLISEMIEGTNTSSAQTYIFIDKELAEEGTYYYWLQNVDLDGSTCFFGPVSVLFGLDGEANSPALPKITQLDNAYPNPFNPNTTIRYQIKGPGKVNIDIYNIRGQIVRSFEKQHDAAGRYDILWNGCDSSGKALASGLYLYRMRSGNYDAVKKMVLQK